MTHATEIENALLMSLDEIEESLGVAVMGWESADSAIYDRSFLLSVADEENPQAAARFLKGSLRQKAKLFFARFWEKLKDIICRLPRDTLPPSQGGLVAYLADLIVAILKIPQGIAVLLAIMIVKKGLDNICSAQNNG